MKACNQCLLDETDYPGIILDQQGICDMCHVNMRGIEQIRKNVDPDYWEKKSEAIRKAGKGKPYDCLIGISGGTGYYPESITVIENMVPFEEMTMGSNYKSYKNKYYLAYMDYAVSLQIHKEQICEVSACEWKSYDAAVQCIREYNREKLNMLQQVHATISSLVLVA